MALARLIPTDAVLPQLTSILDAQTMQRLFEQHLLLQNNHQLNIIACDIERVKYRPGRNCIAGYKLKLGDTAGETEQRVYAGIYTTDEAKARYEKALSRSSFATPYFAPVTHIPAFNMVVWAFPNERKLTALPMMLDSAQLREKSLPGVVRARWGDGWEMVDVSHSIGNYFPEHSCCVGVALTLNRVASNTPLHWEIIGKTRYDDDGAETGRQMAALWRNAHADVGYARPLGYQPQHRLLWQERVPGVTLHSLLVTGQADHAVLARVARAVAALHGTRLACDRRVLLHDILDKLISAQAAVISARPDCAASLRAVAAKLVDSAKSLQPHFDGTWHGDLHSHNILVSPTQIYLVDMDRLAIGPPLADLGSFLAELIYRGCINDQSLEAMRPKLMVIVAAYRQRVSWPVPEQDVAWFTACALIRERALRCVTSLKFIRQETLDQLVSIATQIVDGELFDKAFTWALSSVENTGRAA
jgi:aminoglycoside phosphotransferase (APT) family kinase protein